MCGIVLVPDTPEYSGINARARGPDTMSAHRIIIAGTPYILRFYRLAVFGGKDAEQPFQINTPGPKDRRHIYACNGEIYNWKALNDAMKVEPRGDCWSAAAALSRAGWQKGLEAILGEFAIIQVDLPSLENSEGKPRISIACDTYGVRPLFWALDEQQRFLAVSSMNGVPKELTGMFQRVRGGTWLQYSAETRTINQHGTFHHTPLLQTPPSDPGAYFQDLFLDAVELRCQQIQPDQKIGVLLSGGTDSMAVLAAMCSCMDPGNIVAVTVCFGDIVTPDVDIACEAAINLGVGHHHVVEVPEETLTLDLLRKSIHSLHTFDTTTIRAGTIQHLLYKLAAPVLQEEGVKALLSGEGADELAGGYQYFKMAPDAASADAESTRLLTDICLYDGLRADRTAGAWGKEVRLPFLDVRVVDAYKRWLTADQRWNPQIEKHALRSLLAGIQTPPFQTPSVRRALLRPKDALSDSVGKRWVERLKVMAGVYCEERKFPGWKHCPPRTKEERMYRSLFDEVCGSESAKQIEYFWMPKWQPERSSAALDPSATLLPCFQASESDEQPKPRLPGMAAGMPPGMPPGMAAGFPPGMSFTVNAGGMPPNMGGWAS